MCVCLWVSERGDGERRETLRITDDTNLIFKHGSIENEILSLSKWFDANNLTINIEKTVNMIFRNKKTKITSTR